MRVVFFGTPEFAVPSLEALLGEGFDVAAVVTRPDKSQGRSRSTLVPSPVKAAALEEDVPVLQPEGPSTPEFLEEIRRLAPDAGVVVAYGHLLKPELLAIPKRGMVNVHPSLLPELRGAAPVEWAVLRGLENTGVTIMQMTAGLDSGPILLQLPHRVPNDVTGGELSVHLAEMGAQALVEALALMEQDMLRPVPQEETRATYAPKITRETARIRWDAGPDAVMRATLALDPKPGAWTTLNGQEIKLFHAHV
ncbi:MAG: methionyl-tRNA formyltransferase, partial [Gemmatimonadetes bacterium]